MILKRLSEKPYEMSAIELSNDLGINRSTVHRILKHLIEENLIEQNIENKKYRLGYITHKIGKGYVESREYLEIDWCLQFGYKTRAFIDLFINLI